VTEDHRGAVTVAGPEDVKAIGRLLFDFNREFDEPTPPQPALSHDAECRSA
jgi:hypothetical protein